MEINLKRKCMIKIIVKPVLCLFILSIFLSAMSKPICADELPERLNIIMEDFSWTLQTLDGTTINQDTYADKTILFVFYNATLGETGIGNCYNSNSIISDLAASNWLNHEDLQVIAVDANNNDNATVARYKKTYAPYCDNILFALNGNRLMWQFVRKVKPGVSSITYPVCVVMQGNMIYYEWDGYTKASYCEEVLGSILDFYQGEIDLGVQKHTQAEIEDFIDKNPASMNQTITYKLEPSLKDPYRPGILSEETETSALNLLNQVRYIAGLNADVKLNSEKSEYASASTLLNYLNNMMTHYPKRPDVLSDTAYDDIYDTGYNGSSSSNLGWGYTNLNTAMIYGWLADDDFSNIDRVGHRRWLLNPSMTTIGFGVTGVHSAAYVEDDFRFAYVNTYVAWPAQEMPIKYFNTNYPWSLSLGNNFTDESVSVTLTRKSNGQIWKFSNTSSDGYFNIDKGGYGSPACIIFRPDSLNEIVPDDYFDVNISSNKGEINYTVHFFMLTADIDSTPEPSNSPEPDNTPMPTIRIGDVSSDGNVDANDALLILKIAAKLVESTTEQEIAGDVDGSGTVDANDALLILKKAAKLIDKFPIE